MSDINPIGKDPSGQGSLNGATPTGTYSSQYASSDGGWGAFKHFLGPKDFAQFQQNLCKAISLQINHEHKRAQKAAEQLRKSVEGENIYD